MEAFGPDIWLVQADRLASECQSDMLKSGTCYVSNGADDEDHDEGLDDIMNRERGNSKQELNNNVQMSEHDIVEFNCRQDVTITSRQEIYTRSSIQMKANDTRLREQPRRNQKRQQRQQQEKQINSYSPLINGASIMSVRHSLISVLFTLVILHTLEPVLSLGPSQNDPLDSNSIDLKQQMELIRGATAVELGRSNSIMNRNQRSNDNLAQQNPVCGYPGSPAHASIAFNTSTVVSGTAASYTCDNGYELLGPPRRICQANGSWSPVGIPFCVLNVGLGKAAMQSSTAGQGSAQRAVDGSTSPYFQASTCTMTDVEANPWWYVNLLEPYLVQIVRIDFGMACCANRQKATIAVRVGNNRPDLGNNPLCNRYHGFIEEGKPLFLPCTRPAPGAFVSIHLESPSGSSLSICETFIYTDHALSIEQCPSFRDQPLGSTATYNGKCYLFHNNQALPFEPAKKYCESRGGSLVDETSPALQGFLSWELYRRHRNDQLMGQYWLGAVRDTRVGHSNNWKWINGKDVQITFWNSLSPQGNCSRFDGSKGWLWSGADCSQNLNFICQYRPLSCGKPEKPTNSTLITKNIDNGTVIEYQCAPGNLLMGPKSRTCLPTGFFSEFAPKCKYLDCQFPAQIPNGDYKLLNSTTSYQSIVTYYCNPGYQIYGRATLSCDVDERWNGPPPRCEPLLCAAPVPPTNGYVTVTSNVTTPGTQATYDCRPGYELVGERLLTCSQSGNWDRGFPYCREKRTLVSPPLPKVHFPQSNRIAHDSPSGSTNSPASRAHPPFNNVTPISAQSASPSTTTTVSASNGSNSSGGAGVGVAGSGTASSTTTTISTASLNGLPGQFVGAGQAATASAIDPASSSSSQSPQLNNRKNPPSSLNENQASFDIVASSSSTPQPPSLTAATTTTTTTTATTLSQSRPKIGQQNNFLQNNRQQVNSGIELPQSPSHSSGPSATTNSISVHPGLLSQSQAPPPSAPHQTINQQQLNSLLSNVGSSSIGPISATATSPSSVPILPTLAVSNSATGNTSPSHHHHLHHNQQQQQHQSHKQQQQHTNGANILASSFQPPIRSQNSLASTKYSLDGIIATAIFGGFIFLGAIITIIVIILRRRKSHSPSIDAQTICTFDSNGGEHNGFYRNYQQAWDNLRFATAPGAQPKTSGAHHLSHHHPMTATPRAFKAINGQPINQLHHAHLVTSSINAANGLNSSVGSSQSSSIGGSGGSGGADPLIHQSNSHQLRAAQRRSLQLEYQRARGEEGLASEDDEEQGVLSADESTAIHRRNYRLMNGAELHHNHTHSHSYAHSNEGFRDSNELTVGPDMRPASSSNRNSRLYSISSNGHIARGQSNISVNNQDTTVATSRHSSRPHSHSHSHHHHHHHSRNHSGSGQHQRLVSSSTATTTSSPSNSTRSSRASPQSDDHDLERLAYGNNWQSNGPNNNTANPSANQDSSSAGNQSSAGSGASILRNRTSNVHYN